LIDIQSNVQLEAKDRSVTYSTPVLLLYLFRIWQIKW